MGARASFNILIFFQPAPSSELWQWVHSFYGEELGLTSDDEPDYVSPFSVTPASAAILVCYLVSVL